MEKKAAFVLNNESKCEPRQSETTFLRSSGSALYSYKYNNAMHGSLFPPQNNNK